MESPKRFVDDFYPLWDPPGILEDMATSFENMQYAWGTYQEVDSNTAVITVDYPNGGFGMERITAPRNGSLYETAYAAASVKAKIQGFELGLFSKETTP